MLTRPRLRRLSACPGLDIAPKAVPLKSKANGLSLHAPGHSSVMVTVIGFFEQYGSRLHKT